MYSLIIKDKFDAAHFLESYKGDSLLTLSDFDWTQFDSDTPEVNDVENNQIVFEITVEDKEADKFRESLENLSGEFSTLRYSEK